MLKGERPDDFVEVPALTEEQVEDAAYLKMIALEYT